MSEQIDFSAAESFAQATDKGYTMLGFTSNEYCNLSRAYLALLKERSSAGKFTEKDVVSVVNAGQAIKPVVRVVPCPDEIGGCLVAHYETKWSADSEDLFDLASRISSCIHPNP